jgi:hypothetical protein
LQIWVAGIDSGLTEKGIITPGLGDAVRCVLVSESGGVDSSLQGDRLFNTIRH